MDSRASRPIIVWFRRDLRLADNPALVAAAQSGSPIIPLYIWSPDEEAPWAPGAASRAWLYRSLKALISELAAFELQLVIRKGAALEVLRQTARELDAGSCFWNRLYEPAIVTRDAAVKTALEADGVDARSFKANLLVEPWEVQNSSRRPFLVFTPFWKKITSLIGEPKPLARPRKLQASVGLPECLRLEELGLQPRIAWDEGFFQRFTPGEAGAAKALKRFISEGLADYDERRDIPSTRGTSLLSPHLHFGELSPRQVWSAVLRAERRIHAVDQPYLRELGWREFAHHLIFHYPKTADEPLRPEFARFPWQSSVEALERWQKGQTGYPIVDAGMRQLWREGWMHNRVRMVAASFLVKDLLIPWQTGARWFWDTLVDADLANNSAGWQWTSGCGADAAPYFRVFNPVLQGEKFDAGGRYVRHFVPELAGLCDRWIHRPWEAPQAELERAGVRLGETYPYRMVDHAEAKEAALEAYDMVKGRL